MRCAWLVKQKEYLGAHTSVLGVDPFFKPKTGYYVDFRWLNSTAPRAVLGIPLLPVAGEFRSPEANEILLPSTVTDYVGVQPGAQATIELVYANADPPIVRRLDDVRLVGIFDIAGPDRGRIDPFWRLSYLGEPLLTVRGTGGTEATTTPVLLNRAVVQDFLRSVKLQRRSTATPLPARSQLCGLGNGGGKCARCSKESRIPFRNARFETGRRSRPARRSHIPRSGPGA